LVGGDYVPMPVHDQRWVRQMTAQDMPIAVRTGASAGSSRELSG
jgi:hypothetical protein